MTQKKSSNIKRQKPAIAKDVLTAIMDLYNSHGFAMKEILDQMEKNHTKGVCKNVSKQVLLAIQYGIKVGVLKQRIGKIYFTFTLKRCANLQGNGKKVSKNKRGKRRRRALIKRKIVKRNIGAGEGDLVKLQDMVGWQSISQRPNPLWVDPKSVTIQNEVIILDEDDEPEKNTGILEL